MIADGVPIAASARTPYLARARYCEVRERELDAGYMRHPTCAGCKPQRPQRQRQVRRTNER